MTTLGPLVSRQDQLYLRVIEMMIIKFWGTESRDIQDGQRSLAGGLGCLSHLMSVEKQFRNLRC